MKAARALRFRRLLIIAITSSLHYMLFIAAKPIMLGVMENKNTISSPFSLLQNAHRQIDNKYVLRSFFHLRKIRKMEGLMES